MRLPRGCGDRTCGVRVVAIVLGATEGLAPPCPACLTALAQAQQHWRDDLARSAASAHNVIVGAL